MAVIKKYLPLAIVATALASTSVGLGALTGPYIADASTLALFHFDETSGTIVNQVPAGTALDLTDTGGDTGRDGGGGGGYGATGASGFGTGFHTLAAGDGDYHNVSDGPDTGGGLRNGANVLQSSLQGTTGSFTYEALVKLDNLAGIEQTILAHDGTTTGNRGFLFRIQNPSAGVNDLSFFSGTQSITMGLPSAGTHAISTDTWFHVAVSYTGNENTAGNLTLYWTALDSGATQANVLGTANLTADLVGTINNRLGVGTTTRFEYRFELRGTVDEVRISDTSRGPDQFMFIPEPGSSALLGLSLALATLRRKRSV